MSLTHKKRAFTIGFVLLGVALAAGFMLFALSNNIDLFYTPTQLKSTTHALTKTIRVGGMVREKSLERRSDLGIMFTITDFENDVVVHYRGILPDLFREGQGVVAVGKWEEDGDGVFHAKQILAKHDEKYMPPEVRKTIKTNV